MVGGARRAATHRALTSDCSTGLGFSGYYLASFLDFSGLQYISANLERLILYLNPTIVLAIGALKFHTPVTAKQCIALLVSYLGVCVVFGHDVTVVGPHVALGSALVLASAVSYALYLVYSGQALKRLGAMRITGVASTIACVLCIAQFFILRPPSAMFVAPQVIWLSVLNGNALHGPACHARNARHPASGRIRRRASGNHRPAVDDLPERADPGRAVYTVAGGRHGAGAVRNLAAGALEVISSRTPTALLPASQADGH